MSEHIILIGTYGWQYPEWSQVFYPDDLPNDWQLAYYGNEYPLVVIPAEYWQQGEQTVEQWLEDTDDSPLFICEWPQMAEQQPVARQAIGLLSERVLAILIRPAEYPNDAQFDIYKELSQQASLVFDTADLMTADALRLIEALSELLGKKRFGLCWDGQESHRDWLEYGRVAMTRLSQMQDNRELRRIIETMLAYSGPQKSLSLVIDGDPPDIQLLENAGIILDLL